MNSFKSFVRVTTIIAVLVTVSAVVVAHADDARRVKGIILVIGDGMGINQVRSADIYSRQIMEKPLSITSIATRGTTTTYSANSQVTDSAAAATALLTGHKANNGTINVSPDGRRLFTIGHAVRKAGMSVGVLSTARLTHATPAGVYSHSLRRDDENSIAEQLVEFAPEVAMAGGLRHFIPQDQQGSKRSDGKNLVDVMKANGYTHVTSAEELKTVDPTKTGKLVGLFSMSHMAYDLDRQNVLELQKQPRLADMTKAALSVLERNPKGFFVMIEGGRIDHACHSHDIKASIYETLAFDEAVKVALDYQKAHPDVLVLVTADHETGGLGLGRGMEYALDLAALKPIKNSLGYVAKKVKKDPTKFEELLQAAGFEFAEKEKALLLKHAPTSGTSDLAELNEYPKIDRYFLSWIQYSLASIETERAKIGWTSFVHTAQPVMTYAVGPYEQEFSGAYDNTDIPKKMAELLKVTLEQPASSIETSAK